MSIRRRGQQKTLYYHCLPVFPSRYWAGRRPRKVPELRGPPDDPGYRVVEKTVQTLGVPQHPMNFNHRNSLEALDRARKTATMRTIVFGFLMLVELGLLVLGVANVQPNSFVAPVPALAAPVTVLPFGIPLPVTPAPPPDTDCPADNVRKQSCEPRYVSST